MSKYPLLWVILLTMTPTLELRLSIPYAILHAEWSWIEAASIGIIANILLAPLVWLFVDRVMFVFLKVGWIDRLYKRIAEKRVEKVKPLVDKYGVLGLALFIGVPLPGSGVYSGCLVAYLLKYRFRDAMWASALGCLIAGSIVTLVVVSGNETFHFFVKDLGH